MKKFRELPRWLQRLLRWGLRLSYLGAALVICGLAAYASFSLFVRSGVTSVPSLQGLTEVEAERVLLDQGLTLERLDRADGYDEAVAAGLILRQDPAPRTLVKRGSEVAVALSLGPQVIEVPELGGKTVPAAQVELAAAGLVVGRTVNVFHSGEAGTVVEQAPSGGTVAAPGESIDLVVGRADLGTVYVMPDLVYRNYEDARRFFRQRGFRVGSIKFEVYAGIREGVILRQFPLAGHPLRRNDAISLVVSTTEESVQP
jgi:serine/threonine-protein kinase